MEDAPPRIYCVYLNDLPVRILHVSNCAAVCWGPRLFIGLHRNGAVALKHLRKTHPFAVACRFCCPECHLLEGSQQARPQTFPQVIPLARPEERRNDSPGHWMRYVR